MDDPDRHAAGVAALRSAVLDSQGHSDPAARLAAFQGSVAEGALGKYLADVHSSSHRIVDADVAGLLASGCSQDTVFELTIAAALGASVHRLDAGLAALKAAKP